MCQPLHAKFGLTINLDPHPDQDKAFDAAENFANGNWKVGKYLHSLAGRDPEKLRKYLACLLKSGAFTSDEKGFLIHALGDAYAHTFLDAHPTIGSPKQSRPNPNYNKYVSYGPGIGHGLAGHMPDYIADKPGLYGQYVSQLYSILAASNDGAATHPDWIQSLQNQANNLSTPTFFPDYYSASDRNKGEVDVLKGLDGGFGGSKFHFNPDDPKNPFYGGLQKDDEFERKLIEKIKNGVKGCCPPGK